MPDALDNALALRNGLAHHFFTEHRSDMRPSTGRSRMLRELLDAIEMFEDVRERLIAAQEVGWGVG